MEVKNSTREMLNAVDAELNRLRDRVHTLEARKATLEQWLAEEEPNQSFQQMAVQTLDRLGAKPRDLATTAREIMQDRIARSNSEIEAVLRAKGLIPTGSKLDGRTVNAVMLGLLNRGEVIRVKDKWILK